MSDFKNGISGFNSRIFHSAVSTANQEAPPSYLQRPRCVFNGTGWVCEPILVCECLCISCLCGSRWYSRIHFLFYLNRAAVLEENKEDRKHSDSTPECFITLGRFEMYHGFRVIPLGRLAARDQRPDDKSQCTSLSPLTTTGL